MTTKSSLSLLSLFVILLACSSTKDFTQVPFSGEIFYETRFIPKNSTVNIDSIRNASSGERSTYMISDSTYKSTQYKNGEFSYAYSYNPKTKMMYDYYSDKPYVTYRDSRISNTDPIELTLIKDSTITVLGNKSYLVQYSVEDRNISSYLSDDVKINYERFKDHAVGDWNNHLRQTDGSMSMKSVTEYEDYTEIREAVKIKRRSITLKDTRPPEDLPVVASYSVLDKQAELIKPTPNQIRCYQSKISSVPDQLDGDVEFTSYLLFVLTTDRKIKFLSVYEEDEYGLHEVAKDIINTCKLGFLPGELDGEPVDSEVVFPITFVI